MKSEPIKLQDNLHLYSGDVITINNSSPLLIEITADQTIKLRDIEDDKYLNEDNKLSIKKLLSKSKLKFSTNFESALVFTIKKDNSGKIGLQAGDKYLKSDSKNFSLSSKER